MEKHPLDKGSFWIIVVASIIFLSVSLYDFYILRWRLYEGENLYYLGIVLFIIGYALRLTARIELHKQFSVFVALQKEHKLVTTGMYKYVRHPIYTAGIISFAGFILIMNSVLSLLMAVFLVFPAVMYRIYIEEQMLIGHFGNEYVEYKKKVKALIPWIL
ncbi:MAG: isoprenylcysteine carboxylmethyltransferase family protein [Nanoarchaeota archaeon]